MKPLAPTFSSLSTSRQIKTPGDRFVRVISNAMRPHCFSRFHLPVSLEVPWGTFLRCSGCKPALPSQNQEVIVPSRSIRRFLAGYVQSQRPSGYPQPQLRGTFHPRGKRCHDSLDLFSSQPLFYHKSHYVTRFCGRFVVQTPPKKGP